MAPVLQALEAVTVRVLLGVFLLGQMAFVVRRHASHMGQVIIVIPGGILLWILLQDLNDFPTTVRDQLLADALKTRRRPAHLSWPTLSPEPSLLDHPESFDEEPLSHFSSSSAVMLTVLLKSLLSVSY